MARRQHTRPYLISGDQARALSRVHFKDRLIDEEWLQRLLFDHPQLVPAHEFEPAFSNLFPVVRELPTRVGPADLFYATPEGFLVLAETKLWRNPQARREVVAQIIDYAKDIATWSYSDLESALRKAVGFPSDASFVSLARENSEDFDEARFVDTVTRNLRAGRFLLLLIGDGIREEVEEMAAFLQQTPHLHFTLGLVEIGIYAESHDAEGPLFVQPMIVGRTREVTRAVVELRIPVDRSEISVSLPDTPTPKVRHKITEDEFFEQLGKACEKGVVEFARDVLARAEQQDLEIAWMEAGPCIRFRDEDSGTFFTLGQLNRNGYLSSTERLSERIEKEGMPPEIHQTYLDEIAALIPGASRKKFKSTSGRSEWEQLVFGKGATSSQEIPLSELVPHLDAWFEAIKMVTQRIQASIPPI